MCKQKMKDLKRTERIKQANKKEVSVFYKNL